MASQSPLSIILCGKSPAIATTVIDGLKPEYEVMHVILSPAAGKSEIPLILRGETPPNVDAEALGTKDYSKSADVVVVGRGYDDESVGDMRKACLGTRGVPWLQPDMDKPTPPLGPEYGKHMMGRVRSALEELAKNGGFGEDKVIWY